MGNPRSPRLDEDQRNIEAWAQSLDTLSYLDLLGVDPSDDIRQIQLKYHGFARRFHPDARPWEGPTTAAALVRIFQRGVEAYRVLSHPVLRSRYMEYLSRGQLRLDDFSLPTPVDLAHELPNLHLSCRSGAAKLFAQKAARAFAEGNTEAVLVALQAAKHADSDIAPEVERCLVELRRTP